MRSTSHLSICALAALADAWTNPLKVPSLTTRQQRSFVTSSLFGFNDESDEPLLGLTNGDGQNVTAIAEKRMRVAEAQAKIDRILNDPVDPPFDIESEMKKVVSMSQTRC